MENQEKILQHFEGKVVRKDLTSLVKGNGNEIKHNFNKQGKLRSRPQNEKFYFLEGISWSLISLNFSARYTSPGYLFDVGGSSGFPNREDLYYSLALLNSKVSSYILKGLNFTLNVQVGDIKRILFIKPDETTNSRIKELTIRLVELSKTDFDTTEFSRDYVSNQILLNRSNNIFNSILHVENEITNKVNQFYNYEQEINKRLIDLYRLGKELDPSPELNYLTIYQDIANVKKLENGLLEIKLDKEFLITSFISHSIGCMMGRYRLDQPGLHIAHPTPLEEEVCTYSYNGASFKMDDDAIIPLMESNARFSDDAFNRFNEFVDIVWGAENRTENINFLQECLNKDVDDYLIKHFWKDHCSTYKKKPIYWLFASKTGAFQVLVYMHRMNRFTVEKIRSKYLLPHLRNLQSDILLLEQKGAAISREDARMLDKLRSNFHECEEYDLLLKDKAEQQIEFDLDDGVTENYKLFEGCVAPIK